MQITLRGSQQRLLALWGIGAGGVVLIVALQIMLGKYGDRAEDAVNWLMATIFPNLGVIVGAVAYTAQKLPKDATVNPLAFRTAWWISFFYLVLVALVVFVQPLTHATPLELMTRSHFILSPIQGLVGTALGAFFVSKHVDSEPTAPELAATPAE